MQPKQRTLALLFTLLALLYAVSARAETRIGIYFDCLWEGSREIRAADVGKLREAEFDFLATQITPDALDPLDPKDKTKAVDAQFLEACKALPLQILIIPNALTLPQTKSLLARYPGLFYAYAIADDANQFKPADLLAKYNAAKPYLGDLPAFLTVAKGTKHADYGSLWTGQLYHVQNYLGKAATKGDGLKRYAFDEMLEARKAAAGPLFAAAYPGKHVTPYFLRRDPVFRAQEYSQPATQEAVIWLQLIAGADHVLYYTAYSIGNANPLFESRLADRWDMLAAYKLINGRIKQLDAYLSGPGVAKTRAANGPNVIGTWTKPSGDKLTVTIDLTSELYPRTSWTESKPIPTPTARVTVSREGVQITAPAGVEFATAP